MALAIIPGTALTATTVTTVHGTIQCGLTMAGQVPSAISLEIPGTMVGVVITTTGTGLIMAMIPFSVADIAMAVTGTTTIIQVQSS
jgi:hypothetical protein